MSQLLSQQKAEIICPLDHYRLIEMSGVDAEKFLQGQLTCDVTKLAIGQSTLTAHCDPKGKMNSLFRLIRGGEQQFFALILNALLPHAIEQLKKYAVFSKITFTELDWHLYGFAGAQGIEKSGHFSASFSLHIDSQQPRVILLNPTPLDIASNACSQQWELLDIQDGVPSLQQTTENQFIPQALNLQSIEQAISFSKGCYIGQETVARAKYRGANKRALFIFSAQTEQTVEIGGDIEMQLENGWRKTGCIISAVNFGGVLWLQVVLNTPLEDEQQFRLSGSDILLQRQPLPYELT